MTNTQQFHAILNKFRKDAFSQRDKGDRFERLMQAYLQTDPSYAYKFQKVWLWNDFPSRKDFGSGTDTGIDLVALTQEGDYWAIQCKCYQASSTIDKGEVDSFLSTSSKNFRNDVLETVGFTHRLWISTTNNWSSNAEATIRNQTLPVSRLNLYELEQAPVDWTKIEQGIFGEKSRLARNSIRPHQLEAITNTHEHFKTAERGKLIMACGTGKTFTALKIAEKETNGQGLILFMVPSIALLGQTLREWNAQALEPINAICICSDSAVSRQQNKNDDSEGFSVVDLALPASTNVTSILHQFESIRKANKPGMTVVFSTYQSIEVIANAQKGLLAKGDGTADAYGIFDLIICDEAHRTTGVTLSGDDESAFVKVHDNGFLKARKRIYMTATPRLFSDDTKTRATQNDAELCSMDDERLFGQEMYRIGFGEAVEKGLLTDYKVIILTVTEDQMPGAIQRMIQDENFEINTDDASKLIGCINALSKKFIGEDGVLAELDPNPMRRAVAFCPNIRESKKITTIFNDTSATYTNSLPDDTRDGLVYIASKHVDGTMSAPIREQMLSWLKESPEDPLECRVLTNARCLSEGVDVPSLDAVLFLSARNSQVDVVQSVGRVMRRAPGKKYGYIIIPVVVPSDVEPDKALDNNDRYRVVWTVLNALRAHDDRFNTIINQIDLNKKRPNQILVGRADTGQSSDRSTSERVNQELNRQMGIQFEELQSVVFAKIVQKVGDRDYWEKWAKDIAVISERYIERITRLSREEGPHRAAFQEFLSGLQININPSISESEAIEMLAQHIITQPVFEALFEGYSFVNSNPISVSMQTMLDLLEAQALDKDTESLQKFYDSVRMKAKGIDNAQAKQTIILELYDTFFKTAFPRMVEQLGIVYTPTEVVDFIIRSVDDILKKEFGRALTDENVHILDPFTGTGTFITRLLQSGLIKPKDLERKYSQEIHANELVLLAYYIAAVNIENTYHDLTESDTYQSFDGICLTDTFQLGESKEGEVLFSEMFPKNSDRVNRQKKAPLRVIIGNPPYSVGQKSANDNAQNQKYEKLDSDIAKTYAKLSTAGLNKSLYDAYIKAFRWSSDRLDPIHGGIIAFVSNGAWLDGNSTDGFRKSIENEFSSIWVFNLRGNQRTSGELSRKEGGKIFGSGSRTPISITFLVKNPASKAEKATIYYHDIGDYLSREQKLSIINNYSSVGNKKMIWETIESNEFGDWLNQRNDTFGNYFPLNPEKKFDLKSNSFYNTYAIGPATARDAWVYNFSKDQIEKNMKETIFFYNEQKDAYQKIKIKNNNLKVEDFIDNDPKKISWTRSLRKDVDKGIDHKYKNSEIITAIYRPFCKQKLYFDKYFIESQGLSSKLFPNPQINNLIITTPNGGIKDFYALITDSVRDNDTYGGTQCFPLYYYEERSKEAPTLFDGDGQSDLIRHDGITDYILAKARKQYSNMVSKEDIFYYVYGFLHSPEYRETFSSDLKKMLPRLPLVDSTQDFWAFSKAGRKLAELHLNYESVPPAEGVEVKGAETGFFKVQKMRFPKKGEKQTINFNSKITITNIPEAAYEYVVNGKSAIEWVMERYAVTQHKESGIINDPNDWADEVGNPRYILDLLLSVIRVSVETVAIVKGLPRVTF